MASLHSAHALHSLHSPLLSHLSEALEHSLKMIFVVFHPKIHNSLKTLNSTWTWGPCLAAHWSIWARIAGRFPRFAIQIWRTSTCCWGVKLKKGVKNLDLFRNWSFFNAENRLFFPFFSQNLLLSTSLKTHTFALAFVGSVQICDRDLYP